MTHVIPDVGDIFWVDFDPQAGREQAGKRPALVLSPKSYNERIGLMIVCPITNQAKGYPFEVKLPGEGKIHGVILSDHVKSIDWKVRAVGRVDKVSSEIVEEVKAKLKALLRIL